MKSFVLFTIFTSILLVALTCAHNATSDLTKIFDGVVLSSASRRSLASSATPATLPVSPGACATAHHVARHESLATLSPLLPPYIASLPVKIPSWEFNLRKKWTPVANGRPLASTPTPTNLHTSMVTPPPKLHNRQVPIPYIPTDWRTRVECPAIQGLPCVTVSEYLPYLQGAANKAAEEAARASSLANNGAYIPGMQIPAPSGGTRGVELVYIIWYSYGLAVMCTAMIYMILMVV